MIKYKMWIEPTLKELADGCYYCLQWNNTNDFTIIPNLQWQCSQNSKILTTFLPLHFQPHMPHNNSVINTPFPDRQIWQLSYKYVFTLPSLLSTQFCRNCDAWAKRQIIHMTIRERAENEDVYKRRVFQFYLTKMLANWSTWNIVSCI
jgi:hypothetical protein